MRTCLPIHFCHPLRHGRRAVLGQRRLPAFPSTSVTRCDDRARGGRVSPPAPCLPIHFCHPLRHRCGCEGSDRNIACLPIHFCHPLRPSSRTRGRPAAPSCLPIHFCHPLRPVPPSSFRFKCLRARLRAVPSSLAGAESNGADSLTVVRSVASPLERSRALAQNATSRWRE